MRYSGKNEDHFDVRLESRTHEKSNSGESACIPKPSDGVFPLWPERQVQPLAPILLMVILPGVYPQYETATVTSITLLMGNGHVAGTHGCGSAQVLVDEFEQFVVHRGRFGRSLGDSLGCAMLQVVLHEGAAHTTQCFLHGGYLNDDVSAVAIILHHLLNAS